MTLRNWLALLALSINVVSVASKINLPLSDYS